MRTYILLGVAVFVACCTLGTAKPLHEKILLENNGLHHNRRLVNKVHGTSLTNLFRDNSEDSNEGGEVDREPSIEEASDDSREHSIIDLTNDIVYPDDDEDSDIEDSNEDPKDIKDSYEDSDEDRDVDPADLKDSYEDSENDETKEIDDEDSESLYETRRQIVPVDLEDSKENNKNTENSEDGLDIAPSDLEYPDENSKNVEENENSDKGREIDPINQEDSDEDSNKNVEENENSDEGREIDPIDLEDSDEDFVPENSVESKEIDPVVDPEDSKNGDDDEDSDEDESDEDEKQIEPIEDDVENYNESGVLHPEGRYMQGSYHFRNHLNSDFFK